MKKILSNLFMASVPALSLSPLLAACAPSKTISTTNSSDVLYVQSGTTNDNQEEQDYYACTVSYIGKDCTSDGLAYVARANDCNPKAVHIKLQHFATDEIANKTIVGKLGLKYKMPEHTYAYTSSPLSPNASPDPTWGTHMWQNNGINEMGVGTSATLTTATNAKILALNNESFVRNGVGEELLTTIMTPQAATARQAMEVAAKAIDTYGAQDANIILSIDQNEAWMMEIYSRHQYCAVKLPSDKVFIAGNEFILDSLHDMGIKDADTLATNCIHSEGLLSVPVKAGLAKFKYDASETEKPEDIYHLDLFNTYSKEGINGKEQHGEKEPYPDILFNDRCHMRTWRGYSMFDRTIRSSGTASATRTILPYSNTTKYAPFVTPKDEYGQVRKDMSVADIKEVYRDEFDENKDTTNDRYDPYIGTAENPRAIAVETSRQVHIMSSDPNKPKWLACDEWFTPSSANYAPYIQFNNAVTSFDGPFGYYPDRFVYDENCSAVLYRKLNKLAWLDRTNYGKPLQDFWRVFEGIYCAQMDQVTDDVAKLSSESDAHNILNNFNKHVRDIYIDQIKQTSNDLLWHIMDQPQEGKEKFIPLIDLENYVKELGWSDYKFDGTTATFTRDGITCTYKVSSGVIYGKGTIYINDVEQGTLLDNVDNGKVYVDLTGLNDVIASISKLRTIDINDYLDKKSFNHWVWAGPLIAVVVIGAGVGTYFLVRKLKSKKENPSIN